MYAFAKKLDSFLQYLQKFGYTPPRPDLGEEAIKAVSRDKFDIEYRECSWKDATHIRPMSGELYKRVAPGSSYWCNKAGHVLYVRSDDIDTNVLRCTVFKVIEGN